MTIPVNFIVYGQVKRENGIPINGATIYAEDITTPQGATGSNADANGRFLINVKNFVNDGDTVKVRCTFQRESREQTFLLNVADGTKEINLNLRVIQTITKGYGEGPAVFIRCMWCGYKNYYPKPCESYCCHSCHSIMDEDGRTGQC